MGRGLGDGMTCRLNLLTCPLSPSEAYPASFKRCSDAPQNLTRALYLAILFADACSA
jgi:hypothetical protein